MKLTTETISSSTENSFENLNSVSALKESVIYNDLSETPVVQIDGLQLLQTQLKMLEDIQGRLAFTMREIRYQLKG